jgi:outer membrane protein OmpA-like peptidoglycan-associated protein
LLLKNLICLLALSFLSQVFAQSPEPDAPGCVDSQIVPKLLGCRIDNCERKEADHRDVAVREDAKGDAVTSVVDGDSRSVMYECREGTTPAAVVSASIAALKAAQFEIPYQFSDQEGAVTAKKGDLWVLVEAASRYYTLVELESKSGDNSVADAADMADAIERTGRVAVYGVTFAGGSAEITSDSISALREIAAMLEDNPEWRVRVEEHADTPSLSQQRSAAVVAWLVVHHVRRERLEPAGLADSKGRMELVKIESGPH